MEIVRVVCPKCQTELDVKNKQNLAQKLIKCPVCGSQLMVKFNQNNAPAQPQQAAKPQPAQPQAAQPQPAQAPQQPQAPQVPQAPQPQAQQPQQPQTPPPVPPRGNNGGQPPYNAPYPGSTPGYNPYSNFGNGSETMLVTDFNKAPQANSAFLVYENKRYELKLGRNTIGRQSSTPQATVQIDTHGDKTMSRFHAVIELVRMSDMSIRAIISNGSNKNSTYVSGILLNGNDKLILNNGSEIKMGNLLLRYELPV